MWVATPTPETHRRRLVDKLTVERFVALANVLYNCTRPSDLEKRAPGDTVRQAEIAIDTVHDRMARARCAAWIAKQRDRASCWADTMELLRPGADDGVDAVCRLDLAGLVTAALRVVDGPYRCKR